MAKLESMVTPAMVELAEAAISAEANAEVILIKGRPGSGLRNLCRYCELRLSGAEKGVHFFQVFRDPDPLKVLRDLCYSIDPGSVPGNWMLHSLGQTARLLAKNLREKKISFLILHHADLAGADFFETFFQCLDLASDSQHQCGALLTGSTEMHQLRDNIWIDSPLARTFTYDRLSIGDFTGVLMNWCSGTDELRKELEDRNPRATILLTYIYGKTHGNFQTLSKFALQKNASHPDGKLSMEIAREVIGLITPTFALEP